MPNCADWVTVLLAVARIGAFAVPLSTLYKSRELPWAVRQADIDTLLVLPSYMGHDCQQRLEEAVPGLAEDLLGVFKAETVFWSKAAKATNHKPEIGR